MSPYPPHSTANHTTLASYCAEEPPAKLASKIGKVAPAVKAKSPPKARPTPEPTPVAHTEPKPAAEPKPKPVPKPAPEPKPEPKPKAAPRAPRVRPASREQKPFTPEVRGRMVALCGGGRGGGGRVTWL